MNTPSRFLGVDYGTARIGLAIGVREPAIASPLRTIDSAGSPSKDAAVILRVAESEEADAIVLGLPLNMDGTEGPQAALTLRVVEMLKRQTARPVVTWDERLSSHRADELLASAGRRSGKGARGRDAMSAQVILQSFLNAGAPVPPSDGT